MNENEIKELKRLRTADMFDELVKQQLAIQPVNECDYVDDETGLLMCGICGEPKREYITAPDGTRKVEVPIMCRCRREEKAKDDADVMAQKVLRLKRAANIPPSMADMTFDTIEVTDENRALVEECREYADKFIEPSRDGRGYKLGKMYRQGKGLLLYGKSGTGKTCFAVCIANCLLNQGVPVIMVSLPSYMSTVEKGADAEAEMLSKLDTAALAILDDYGAERSTEYALEKVYQLINDRYTSGKPMIVTTNFTATQMFHNDNPERARINDRLYQVRMPLEFAGKSRRRTIAAKIFKNHRAFFDS